MSHIPYKIIRSERKSLSLKIDKDARLIVHAPKNISEEEIEKIIEKHSKWIEKKQLKTIQGKEKYSKVSLKNGGEFWCLGQKYTVEISENASVEFCDDTILIPGRYRRSDVISWMKWEAGRYIKIRTDYFSKKIGVKYTGLHITDAKTRWGSCSAKDRLNFSWHLLMCPPEVIDYVVIHELCHVIHKNHSKEFWQEVEKYSPEYMKHRLWLKNNQEIMELL